MEGRILARDERPFWRVRDAFLDRRRQLGIPRHCLARRRRIPQRNRRLDGQPVRDSWLRQLAQRCVLFTTTDMVTWDRTEIRLTDPAAGFPSQYVQGHSSVEDLAINETGWGLTVSNNVSLETFGLVEDRYANLSLSAR